jgi:hypothetical protein
MLGRSIIALSLAFALVAATPVARTRMFCRMTGIEIPPNACMDESGTTSQQLTPERCCEHRIQAPLGAAKFETQSRDNVLLTEVAVELQWFVQFAASAERVRDVSPPSPPPLSATRILLI